jgi:transposase-like protein
VGLRRSRKPAARHLGPLRKRGRPPGSVSLTAEKASHIVTPARGGASLRSAAEITGTPIRTVQDWIARGSGLARTALD